MGSLSGGAWEGGIVAIPVSSESKVGLDAKLADSLSAGRATAKAVIDRLVMSGPMGRGTPCCSLSETSEMNRDELQESER